MSVSIGKAGTISPINKNVMASSSADNIQAGILSVAHGGTGQDFSLATPNYLLYFSSNGTFGLLPIGLEGQVLSISLGVATWANIFTQLSDLTDVTSAAQTPNLVLATPDGVGGAYLGRQLVVNDIPDLPASKITSGTLPTARGGTGADLSVKPAGEVLYTDGSGGVATLPVGAEGYVLKYASGTLSWADTNSITVGARETLIDSAAQTVDGSYLAPIFFTITSPTSYRAIKIIARANPSVNSWLQLTINGDSATNYVSTFYVATATGHNLSAHQSRTQFDCGWLINNGTYPMLQYSEILISNLDFSLDDYVRLSFNAVSYNAQHSGGYCYYNVATPTINTISFALSSTTTFRQYEFYVYGIK